MFIVFQSFPYFTSCMTFESFFRSINWWYSLTRLSRNNKSDKYIQYFVMYIFKISQLKIAQICMNDPNLIKIWSFWGVFCIFLACGYTGLFQEFFKEWEQAAIIFAKSYIWLNIWAKGGKKLPKICRWHILRGVP